MSTACCIANHLTECEMPVRCHEAQPHDVTKWCEACHDDLVAELCNGIYTGPTAWTAASLFCIEHAVNVSGVCPGCKAEALAAISRWTALPAVPTCVICRLPKLSKGSVPTSRRCCCQEIAATVAGPTQDPLVLADIAITNYSKRMVPGSTTEAVHQALAALHRTCEGLVGEVVALRQANEALAAQVAELEGADAAARLNRAADMARMKQLVGRLDAIEEERETSRLMLASAVFDSLDEPLDDGRYEARCN